MNIFNTAWVLFMSHLFIVVLLFRFSFPRALSLLLSFSCFSLFFHSFIFMFSSAFSFFSSFFFFSFSSSSSFYSPPFPLSLNLIPPFLITHFFIFILFYLLSVLFSPFLLPLFPQHHSSSSSSFSLIYNLIMLSCNLQ